MDSPSARQNRIAYDSTLTRDPAFPHGSSSEVRDGHDSPPTSVQVEERRGLSALSVEPRGVAALPEGFPEDASHGSNVRAGPSAGASHTAEDLAQLPHEAELLARLLQQARATQYAGLLAELGAVNAEDLSIMAAAELAPMPIIRAKRLIRCAAAAVAESETYDQDRVEREMLDADRAAEAEAKQGAPPFDGASAEDRERARMAAGDDAEIGGRVRDARPNYRSNLPFGVGSSFRRSAGGRDSDVGHGRRRTRRTVLGKTAARIHRGRYGRAVRR